MTDDNPRQKTTIQLPTDLHDWLRSCAFVRRQSMNALAVEVLEAARAANWGTAGSHTRFQDTETRRD